MSCRGRRKTCGTASKRLSLAALNGPNVISTNPTRQHESDILVTRYFIATNTPFNAASNKHLAKLVQFLRPGTTVPDRRRIGGELLDEIYASEQTKVKRMVSGSNVTLAIDGWSTLTNEPVLGVSFYHCGKCYLVNTMSTIGESHTTEYLVQVTREQMEHVRKVLWASRRLESWLFSLNNSMSDFKTQFCF